MSEIEYSKTFLPYWGAFENLHFCLAKHSTSTILTSKYLGGIKIHRQCHKLPQNKDNTFFFAALSKSFYPKTPRAPAMVYKKSLLNIYTVERREPSPNP
jgi:hypothetical protein